jgi:diguanylate cyclase (GGDEF)-like protein/PAS domain S-box-containing protein
VVEETAGRSPAEESSSLHSTSEMGSKCPHREAGALPESEERFRSIFDNSLDGILLTDPDGRCFAANSAACQMLRRSEEDLKQVGRPGVVDLSDPSFQWALSERKRTGRYKGETTYVRKDGTRFPVEISTVEYMDANGLPWALVIFRDISERRLAERSLVESEQKYRDLTDSLPLCLFEADLSGRITFANRSAFQMFGYTTEDLDRGIAIFDLIVGEELDRLRCDVAGMFAGNAAGVGEYTALRRDGSTFPMDASATPIIIDGIARGFRGFVVETTQRKVAESEFRYLSIHDAVTGLYNRIYFEQEMSRLENGRNHPVSLLMLDVDGLKAVNDSYGHPVGDELLKRTAAVLRSVFRAQDVVARIGGDEFAVWLPETDSTSAESTLNRVKGALAVENELHGGVPLSFSVGVATADDAGLPLSTILKVADDRMYLEKTARFGRRNP